MLIKPSSTQYMPDVGLITHPHTSHNQSNWGITIPPLKSLKSLLGPNLWGSVSTPIRGYWADSDTICNNPRKSASHICAIPQKALQQNVYLATKFSEEIFFHHKKVTYSDELYISSLIIKKLIIFSEES